MERIRILCYGDSNTWGFIPAGNHKRYDINERWTGILKQKLGDDYEVIEEGLSSRTLLSPDDDGSPGKVGYDYLIPCLETHDPVDIVILMLGTNELKTVNNKTSEEIGNMLEEYFVKAILRTKNKSNNIYPKLIIVCPPVVDEEKELCKAWNNFVGAYEKSIKLDVIYKSIAKRNSCYYISNDGFETGIDGIHLTKDSHELVAYKLYSLIKEIYKKV